jgi:hypothetical protein
MGMNNRNILLFNPPNIIENKIKDMVAPVIPTNQNNMIITSQPFLFEK